MSLAETKKRILFAIIILILNGCIGATERYISPSIKVAPRVNLQVNTSILCSVFDGRVGEQVPRDSALQIKSDLSKIYGQSIEWNNYFDEVPFGRLAIRIRMVTLGATFGSRLISSSTFVSAVNLSQVNATGNWGSIVGSIISKQSISARSFIGEGWWNGAAWIDLEVDDNRSQERVRFTIPIVAEHRETNLWGYRSADKAAEVAWHQASVHLLRALDTIFRRV